MDEVIPSKSPEKEVPIAKESNLTEIQEKTYNATLKKNIELKRKFLNLATKALEDIKESESIDKLDEQIDDEILEKMKVIAFHDTLKKLPFTPARDDLVGISLATTDLSEQKKEIDESVDRLKEEVADIESNLSLSAYMADDFEKMTELLEKRTAEVIKQRDELKREVQSLTENSTVTRLQKQIDALKQRENEIISYPGEIVSKYLIEEQASIYQPNIKSEELRKRKEKAFELFELLLNNVVKEQEIIDNLALDDGNPEDIDLEEDDIYITVNNKDDPLIRHLLRADIIVEKKNSNKIKLRPYMRVFDQANF